MRFYTRLLAGILIASTLVCAAAVAKTLKMAYDADPVTLDIHEQLSGGTLQLSHMVFDPLVRWKQDYTFAPRLARSWEQINPTTTRFRLRQGVKFHSGNTLTSADVKWTFDRLKQSDDFKGIFALFKDLKVIDEYTFELITEAPYPLVLHSATYIFPMDSKFYTGTTSDGKNKHEIIKHGDSFASRNASGTGPYVVTYREQGVRTEFKRVDNYWDKKSKGNVEKIVLTPIKESATRVAALLSGDVDFIAPVPPTDHQRIKNNSRTKLITLPGARIITFQMNQDRVDAFKDKRVRLAFDYAINNAGIVSKIMRGFATTAGQASPAGYQGHSDTLKPRYNLKKAQQLMKDAGYEDGFSITMMAPNNRYVNDAKIAQAVASMLSKIKVTVDLQTMPKAQYWPTFDERAADMMMIGWHSDTDDSANFHQFLTACPNKENGNGQYNSGNYCNSMTDSLMDKANAEINPTVRKTLLQKLERILYQEAAFIPLHWQNLSWGVRKEVKARSIVNEQNFPYLGDLVIK